MAFTSLKDRLPNLPIIIAGPILRRVEPNSVTVWIALREARRVTLRVYRKEAAGAPVTRMSGTANTVKLGAKLHILAVTASIVPPLNPLQGGEIYHYDLFFDSNLTGSAEAPEEDERSLRGGEHLNRAGSQTITLHYPGTGMDLPSFVLPPDSLPDLRLIHGSCRKPHGEGKDLLPYVDTLIAASAADPIKRPHQFFLTGDQIYADDVAASLLDMLMDAEEHLLGWSELLPNVAAGETGLEPGKRDELAEEKAWLSSTDNTSHLFTLGEFYAMYLFVWSDRLWDADLPTAHANEEHDKSLIDFRNQLPAVRRALANIPCYMICDDHEVTDDWYLTLQWCSDVLSSPLGHRIILNGSLAYALFQAWGNTPEQFVNGKPGGVLLSQVVNWKPNENPLSLEQVKIAEKMARVLCVPGGHRRESFLQQLRRERGFAGLHKAGETLDFFYAVQGPQHQVIVLDTRTWRGYPGDRLDNDEIAGDDDFLARNLEDGSSSAALLDVTGLEQQILAHKATEGMTKPIIFVVAPGPVFNLRWVLRLRRGLQFFPHWFSVTGEAGADYEDWEAVESAVKALLASLADFGPTIPGAVETINTRVVFLSGDVHYGFTMRMRYDRSSQDPGAIVPIQAIFAQLNASSFHHEAGKTRATEFAGYEFTRTGRPKPREHMETENVQITPPGVTPAVTKPFLVTSKTWCVVATPPASPPPLPLPPPAASDTPADAMKKTAAIGSAQRAPRSDMKPKNEVVGVNNFGDVSFAGSGRTLVHTIHWNGDGSTSKYLVDLALESFTINPFTIDSILFD